MRELRVLFSDLGKSKRDARLGILWLLARAIRSHAWSLTRADDGIAYSELHVDAALPGERRERSLGRLERPQRESVRWSMHHKD